MDPQGLTIKLKNTAFKQLCNYFVRKRLALYVVILLRIEVLQLFEYCIFKLTCLDFEVYQKFSSQFRKMLIIALFTLDGFMPVKVYMFIIKGTCHFESFSSYEAISALYLFYSPVLLTYFSYMIFMLLLVSQVTNSSQIVLFFW